MIIHDVIKGGIKIPSFSSVAIILIIVGIVFMLWQTNESNYNELNRKIYRQQQIIDSLMKRDSMLNKIVLKQNMEKKSGINIPEKVPFEHLVLIVKESKKNNVPLRITTRLINKESRFNQNAVSSAGATGYTQTMPNTFKGYAKKINLKPINTPENNIKVGIYYLSSLHKIWKKRGYSDNNAWILALSSYNAGIGRVGENPKYYISKRSFTNKYVSYILS